MQRIRAWWAAWQLRRRWTPERQLEHLRTLVRTDWRWLASDTVASALTERYLAALAPDWFSRVHEDVSQFRSRLAALKSTSLQAEPMTPREAACILAISAAHRRITAGRAEAALEPLAQVMTMFDEGGAEPQPFPVAG